MPAITFLNEFTDFSPEISGGKARNLAKLLQSGISVPVGFVIDPDLLNIDSSQNHQIYKAIDQLTAHSGARQFAVRSSANVEDGASASFAGIFESKLNISKNEILPAILEVLESKNSPRVKAYLEKYQPSIPFKLFIIVQVMVEAVVSGVIFTADPITGSRKDFVGNMGSGLGEELVAGLKNPSIFRIARKNGFLHVHDNNPDTANLRTYSQRLYQLCHKIEKAFDTPQDIEWAIDGDEVWILQARPITNLRAHNPLNEKWNDSFLGDYLWTSTNFGEALPEVMTPLTWSMMQTYLRVNKLGIEKPWFPMGGNIEGRFYMNLSFMASYLAALGFSNKKIRLMIEDLFGRLPDDLEIPIIHFNRLDVLKNVLPNAFRRARIVRQLKQDVQSFVNSAPGVTKNLNAEIKRCDNQRDLLNLWRTTLGNHLEKTMLMLAAGTSDYKNLLRKMRKSLDVLVGKEKTNELLSGIDQENYLESLGLLIGIGQVASGEISEAAYMERFGHRGPNELELSEPTPAETEGWLANQAAMAGASEIKIEDLVHNRREQHNEALAYFAQQHPGKLNKISKQLRSLSIAGQTRESVRSEVVRMLRVLRRYALKTGELTGLGHNIFFLDFNEIESLLATGVWPEKSLKLRKIAYESARTYPPYPPIIRGRFNPALWSKDINRRSDIHNTTKSDTPLKTDLNTGTLTGFAGAAGIVSGRVRVLESLEQADELKPGDILVTHLTNIGWTPFFTRISAIVTDIGAPLSHAAIVAREIGIPAVVGTGSATSILKTGDLVEVDGSRGKVTIL